MLGYVMIDKPELKVREYEVYCGYYCGICKSIGRRYGQLPRMALSYDAAFLAILLESLSDTQDAPTQEHCIAHRIKKKTIIRNAAIDYAADVMLILAWYKLLDDAADEGKVYAKALTAMLKGVFKKLRRQHPALCEGIEGHLTELSALEKEKCESLDMAAEAFSKIMEVIFAEGAKLLYGNEPDAAKDSPNSNDSRSIPEGSSTQPAPLLSIGEPSEQFSSTNPAEALARLGYHLGKWIYLMDAVDDIAENIDSGAYNPLLYRFRYDADTETPESFRARIAEDLNFNLYHSLAIAGNCVNALDIKKNKGIIENIIYFGLNRKTEDIIAGREPETRI